MAIGTALAMMGGAPAARAHELTYNVTQTYNQVVYDASGGWDTVFTGSFVFDETTMDVTGLTGSLSQAMMAAMGMPASVPLTFQLSSVYDPTLGGLLVSVFHQNSTDVFQGGGFATGGTKEFGNQNAYVTVFVNTTDPTLPLTEAQTRAMAYGDCTDGSLMGTSSPKTCMTGWLKPDGTAGGTMMGTAPISQTITAVPEPGSYAMLLAGLGLTGFVALRRRAA
ncbi:MAG: hypothetical protein OHK0026_05690 [Rhodocyclaceae bacterium]